MSEFSAGFFWNGENVTVKQYGLELASERFDLGVVIAVALAALTGRGVVLGQQIAEVSSHVLAALVGLDKAAQRRAGAPSGSGAGLR